MNIFVNALYFLIRLKRKKNCNDNKGEKKIISQDKRWLVGISKLTIRDNKGRGIWVKKKEEEGKYLVYINNKSKKIEEV